MAAEGIGVWNPSFDVAPGRLIAGIITDKGTAIPSTPDGYEEQKIRIELFLSQKALTFVLLM